MGEYSINADFKYHEVFTKAAITTTIIKNYGCRAIWLLVNSN